MPVFPQTNHTHSQILIHYLTQFPPVLCVYLYIISELFHPVKKRGQSSRQFSLAEQ